MLANLVVPAVMTPTLLHIPRLLNGQPVPGAFPEQHALPLPADAYTLTQSGGMCFVNERASGRFVYAGPGPVVIAESPAPF